MAPFFYAPLTRSVSCAKQRLLIVFKELVSFDNSAVGPASQITYLQ